MAEFLFEFGFVFWVTFFSEILVLCCSVFFIFYLQEVSPLTSGRLSHSSGPLNGGSLTETDSPPVSPSDEFDDVVKVKKKIL